MIRINNIHPRLSEFMESGNDKLEEFWEDAKVEMKFELNDMAIINAAVDDFTVDILLEIHKIKEEHSSRYKYLCNQYLHECDDENKLKEVYAL